MSFVISRELSMVVISGYLPQGEPNTYIEGERARAVHFLVTINTDEGMPALVQRTLEADDDELECIRCMRSDVVGYLCHIRIVQRRVDFVKNKERAGLVTVQGSAPVCQSLKLSEESSSAPVDGK